MNSGFVEGYKKDNLKNVWPNWQKWKTTGVTYFNGGNINKLNGKGYFKRIKSCENFGKLDYKINKISK